MKQALVVLVLLFEVTHAVFSVTETNCNATQGSSMCSVSLGGTVYIQVMANASGHQLRCKKHLSSGFTNVFTLKRDKTSIQEALENRTELFISNGTFKITKVERTDLGQYTIEVFDPNGILLGTTHVQLDVQENILPVLISVSVVGLLLIAMVAACCIYSKKRRTR